MSLETIDKRKGKTDILSLKFAAQVEFNFLPRMRLLLQKSESHRRFMVVNDDDGSYTARAEVNTLQLQAKIDNFEKFIRDEYAAHLPNSFYVKERYLLDFLKYTQVADQRAVMQWKEFPKFLHFRKCDHSGEEIFQDDLVICLFVLKITDIF